MVWSGSTVRFMATGTEQPGEAAHTVSIVRARASSGGREKKERRPATGSGPRESGEREEAGKGPLREGRVVPCGQDGGADGVSRPRRRTAARPRRGRTRDAAT